METIEAIYEGGVFRPVNPVALPDRSRVALQIVKGEQPILDDSKGMDEIYEILDRRYNSGHSDTAERHNEHQP
jgi:predicted DNA-binding antitoxin AbrB/MazE fold protein